MKTFEKQFEEQYNDLCHNHEMLNVFQGYVPQKYILDRMKRKKKERIDKRKANGLNNNGFIMIDVDYHHRKRDAVIMAVKPLEEKLFTYNCKEKLFTYNCKDINEVTSAIPVICNSYNIKQVFIDISGFGIEIADALMSNRKIIEDDIDIVPMRASRMFN